MGKVLFYSCNLLIRSSNGSCCLQIARTKKKTQTYKRLLLSWRNDLHGLTILDRDIYNIYQWKYRFHIYPRKIKNAISEGYIWKLRLTGEYIQQIILLGYIICIKTLNWIVMNLQTLYFPYTFGVCALIANSLFYMVGWVWPADVWKWTNDAVDLSTDVPGLYYGFTIGCFFWYKMHLTWLLTKLCENVQGAQKPKETPGSGTGQTARKRRIYRGHKPVEATQEPSEPPGPTTG